MFKFFELDILPALGVDNARSDGLNAISWRATIKDCPYINRDFYFGNEVGAIPCGCPTRYGIALWTGVVKKKLICPLKLDPKNKKL